MSFEKWVFLQLSFFSVFWKTQFFTHNKKLSMPLWKAILSFLRKIWVLLIFFKKRIQSSLPFFALSDGLRILVFKLIPHTCANQQCQSDPGTRATLAQRAWQPERRNRRLQQHCAVREQRQGGLLVRVQLALQQLPNDNHLQNAHSVSARCNKDCANDARLALLPTETKNGHSSTTKHWHNKQPTKNSSCLSFDRNG